MKGLAQLDAQDHTVILGYLAGRTERMVGELSAEGNRQLVLCAWNEVAVDPLPEQPEVQFVRGGGNTYSVQLPERLSSSTFGESQTHFGQRFGATLIAVRSAGRVVVSPGWDSAVESGATLYYLAKQRIDGSDLAPPRRQS